MPIVGELPLLKAADWKQWRGEGQQGRFDDDPRIASATGLEFRVRWRRPLGSGYAAFSTDSGRAYSMAARDGQDFVIAMDLMTGEERWRRSLGSSYLGHDGSDDGPIGTPTVDSGMVFALDAQGRFVALDAQDGSLLWSYDLAKDFASRAPFYGFSTVPLVEGDSVLLQIGGGAGKGIAAFHKRTGRVIWSAGDGQVTHQNPSLATLAETRQVIAAFDDQLMGLNPADGAVLWTHSWSSRDRYAQVFAIDGDRFIAAQYQSTSLFRVRKAGAGLQVEKLWETRNFKRTHSVPVYLDGYLYGFNSSFLTCLDAETGEAMWKSRRPGGEQVAVWNGHLLIPASGGELVAVAAQPDRYRELGRLQALDQHLVYSPPSFAPGVILLRDLKEAVAVEALSSNQVPLVEARPDPAFSRSRFARFVARLEASDQVEKRRMIEEFQRRHDTLPLREGDLVHFVHVGTVEELAISGDMTGHWTAEPMHRVSGTDFYYRTFSIEPGNRWEYRFFEFDKPLLDAGNPNQVENDTGAVSVVEFEWQPVTPPPAHGRASQGRLHKLQIPSAADDSVWTVHVYTPAGYDPSGPNLPLAVVGDGARALKLGIVQEILDREIGRTTAPLLVAFLEMPEPTWFTRNLNRVGEILSQDILPVLERDFRVSKERGQRLLMCHGHRQSRYWSNCGNLLYSALRLPDLFAHVAMQSPVLEERTIQRNLVPLLGSTPKLHLYLDWGRYDARNPNWGLDVAKQAPRLAGLFLEHGHRVDAGQRPGGLGWHRWRNQFGEILRLFFPLQQSVR